MDEFQRKLAAAQEEIVRLLDENKEALELNGGLRSRVSYLGTRPDNGRPAHCAELCRRHNARSIMSRSPSWIPTIRR